MPPRAAAGSAPRGGHSRPTRRKRLARGEDPSFSRRRPRLVPRKAFPPCEEGIPPREEDRASSRALAILLAWRSAPPIERILDLS
jgi:hypothetical protein